MNPTPTDLLPPEELTPVNAGLPPPESLFTLLLRDHALQILIALALVANLALFAYLAVRFEALPDPLPLHYDVAGQPDRIEAKSGIFGLPIIGLIVFVVNAALGVLVLRRQRGATLLLAVGALLAQVLMWFAAINIIGGLV